MSLLIKGTTMALSASVIATLESGDERAIAAAANPIITVDQSDEVTYLRVAVGPTTTVEIGLGNNDRLDLVALLLGERIPEGEARALDGNR